MKNDMILREGWKNNAFRPVSKSSVVKLSKNFKSCMPMADSLFIRIRNFFCLLRTVDRTDYISIDVYNDY